MASIEIRELPIKNVNITGDIKGRRQGRAASKLS